MGSLLYGSGTTAIQFEDRTLAHLQVVICAKLRRGESFVFTFADVVTRARHSLFLCDSIPLQFLYEGENVPSLNRGWLEELSVSANSASGLRISEENAPLATDAPGVTRAGLPPAAAASKPL
jgi:hypothetical protein